MAPTSIHPHHQQEINLLRERLKPSGLLSEKYDTDFNLLRWLQEFDFDMDKTYSKLRYHLRFRKSWDLDNLIHSDEKNSLGLKYWNGFVGGWTGKKNNLIVSGDYLALPDIAGLFRTIPPMEVARAKAYIYEKQILAVMEQEAASGKQSGTASILDFQGLKLTREMLKIVNNEFKALINFYGAHYGVYVGQFFAVNMPSAGHYLWKIFQPLMPGKTAGKLQIMGSNWRQEILEWVDPAALPTIWGGKLQIPPNLFLYIPEKIPENLHATNELRDRNIFKHPLVQTLTIHARKSEILTINATTVGGKIQFKFLSNGGIDHGVFWAPRESDSNVDEMEMVCPQFLGPVGPTFVPNECEFVCEKPGYYKFWFANHSWFFKVKIWAVVQSVSQSVF